MEPTPLENWIIRKSGIGEGSRKLLEEYQINLIKKTIEYSKSRSRFYGEMFRNISPNEINCLSDMQKIPFTFPQDIQKDPFRFSCVPQSDIKRVVTLNTTGTSGEEKRILFSEEDLEQTVEFFVYGMSCLADETDRVMVLLPGPGYGSIGDLLKKALEKFNIECFVNGVIIDYEETANEIISKKISCLVGIPSQVMKLSRLRSDIFISGIKSVLLSTDYVPETLIHELTDRYGCRVFTHYGMTEMGYGGGVECEARNGYHMREAELLFEIVNPVTGEPVPDGQWGEVVFTTLSRIAMPLIRYRTGDIAAFSEELCPCGTFLKTMARVSGRLNNRVKLFEKEFLYQSELDEIIFSFREFVDYKACLTKGNNLLIDIETGSAAFERLKDRVTLGVKRYIDERFRGAADIKITVSRKNEADSIKNSMVKRMIRDLRE
ncbi:MAG: phenylacetate--CoA ligase family protein [Oscillospiraceae bacterium]